MLHLVTADPAVTLRSLVESGKQRSAGIKRMVQPRSINQRRYVEAIEECDMVFGVGPAGTGKTYLAVAMAASALLAKKVSRIILVQARGRSRRAPGLSAWNAAGEGRPLSAPALRRTLRPAGAGPRGQDAGAERDRGGPAGLYARAHAQRRLHHHGRGAEHHQRADEDVPDPPGQQLQSRHHRRRHPDRSAQPQEERIWWRPSRSCEGVDGIRFCHFEDGDVVRHHLVQRVIRAYDSFGRAQRELPLQSATTARFGSQNRSNRPRRPFWRRKPNERYHQGWEGGNTLPRCFVRRSPRRPAASTMIVIEAATIQVRFRPRSAAKRARRFVATRRSCRPWRERFPSF